MPIYADINTAFVHIPKTGGSSVAAALYRANKNANGRTKGYSYECEKHETVLDIQKYCEDHNFRRLYKFSVVRNPWDRLGSWFFYYKKLWEKGQVCDKPCSNSCGNLFLDLDFNDWILSLERNSKLTCTSEADCPLMPLVCQTRYLTDYGGFIIVDDIMKYELLDGGWEYICSKIGIDVASLPHYNEGSAKVYKNLYTPETEKIVHDIYKVDIDAFSYNFNDKY